jgi:triacylglycerol lipase
MALGDGATKNTPSKRDVTALRASTRLNSAKLQSVFSGSTANVQTGFGDVPTFKRGGMKHAIIATRGTRVEHSPADAPADLRASLAGFGGYGQVHAGFYNAFASIVPNLGVQEALVRDADVLHCIGHSLGGAIATLVAAHDAGKRGQGVRRHAFGSLRVGAHVTPQAFESLIGKSDIFRVAHDLDPGVDGGPVPVPVLARHGQYVEMADENEVEGEMPDVAAFLARAQAAREPLAPRIDDSFVKVDQAALAAALARCQPPCHC